MKNQVLLSKSRVSARGTNTNNLYDIMKISAFWHQLGLQYPGKFRFIKKGQFWILVNEEAYVIAEYFHFKLTKLDSEHIQMGFPVKS